MRGTGMGDKPLTIAGEYGKIERPRLLVFIWVPDQQENTTETLECVRRDLEEKDGVYEDAPDVLGIRKRNCPCHEAGLRFWAAYKLISRGRCGRRAST